MADLSLGFRLFRALILIISGALLLVLLIFEFWQSYDLFINRVDIDLESVDHPIKVAVISDIQYHSANADITPLKQAVFKVNAENPDLVFLLGDFLNEKDSMEILIENLSEIDEGIPIYAVLGNWDYDEETIATSELVDNLEKAGVRVLINEIVKYTYAKDSQIQIGGLDQAGFKWRYPGWAKMMKKLNSELPLIAITHYPDAVDEIEAFGYEPDLIIAGDTHGGQIRLPLIDTPLYAPGKYGLIYSAGLYKTKAGLLYVNRGLGVNPIFPYRINNPPELTFLTLY